MNKLKKQAHARYTARKRAKAKGHRNAAPSGFTSKKAIPKFACREGHHDVCPGCVCTCHQPHA